MAAQISTSELVSYDKITYRGLREVRIMRYGKSENDYKWAERWINQLCPAQARELATWRVTKEEDLDYYYLFLWWNARELVTFSEAFKAPLKAGVLWYVRKGAEETVTDAAESAAMLFQEAGKRPTTLWIGKEPVCKRATITTAAGELAVITGEMWVPERYIVVGRAE